MEVINAEAVVRDVLHVVRVELDRFLQDVFRADVRPGRDWTSLVMDYDATRDTAKSDAKGPLRKQYNRLDPQLQLYMLNGYPAHRIRAGWHPFEGRLNAHHLNCGRQLQDLRNDLAHFNPMTRGHARKAINAGGELLCAIRAFDAAERVAALGERIDGRTGDSEGSLGATTRPLESSALTGRNPTTTVPPRAPRPRQMR